MHKPSNAVLRNDLFGTDSDNRGPEDRSIGDTARRSQLLNARRDMETELQRMRSTTAVIEESSKTIGSVNEKYTLYGASLSKASKTLKALKTKMENDDKYIYYSFLFFLFVSGYVFLKRVKIIAITSWFATKMYGVTSWVTGLSSSSEIPITTQPPPMADTTLPPYERPMLAPTNSTRRKSPNKLEEEL